MPSNSTEHGLSELKKREENRGNRGSSLTHNLSRHLSHNLVALSCAAGFFVDLTQAALVTPNRESNAVMNAADESSATCAIAWNSTECAQSGGVKPSNAPCECAPVSHKTYNIRNPRMATDGRTMLIFRRSA